MPPWAQPQDKMADERRLDGGNVDRRGASEGARERELAMAGEAALALAWGLVCWGFAKDLASCAECGAWARPVGEVAGRLVAPEDKKLAWRGGTSPGGDVRGDEGEALASAGE